MYQKGRFFARNHARFLDSRHDRIKHVHNEGKHARTGDTANTRRGENGNINWSESDSVGDKGSRARQHSGRKPAAGSGYATESGYASRSYSCSGSESVDSDSNSDSSGYDSDGSYDDGEGGKGRRYQHGFKYLSGDGDHRSSQRQRSYGGGDLGISGNSRSVLQDVRVVKKDLAYVVGLPMELGEDEAKLKSFDFFGKYGRIINLIVNNNPNFKSPDKRKSCAVYITYATKEEARSCILDLDDTAYQSKQIRASFGTTKYCSNFLKGLKCTNRGCFYLHVRGSSEDSFTVKQLKSIKNHSSGLTCATLLHEELQLSKRSKPNASHSLFGMNEDDTIHYFTHIADTRTPPPTIAVRVLSLRPASATAGKKIAAPNKSRSITEGSIVRGDGGGLARTKTGEASAVCEGDEEKRREEENSDPDFAPEAEALIGAGAGAGATATATATNINNISETGIRGRRREKSARLPPSSVWKERRPTATATVAAAVKAVETQKAPATHSILATDFGPVLSSPAQSQSPLPSSLPSSSPSSLEPSRRIISSSDSLKPTSVESFQTTAAGENAVNAENQLMAGPTENDASLCECSSVASVASLPPSPSPSTFASSVSFTKSALVFSPTREDGATVRGREREKVYATFRPLGPYRCTLDTRIKSNDFSVTESQFCRFFQISLAASAGNEVVTPTLNAPANGNDSQATGAQSCASVSSVLRMMSLRGSEGDQIYIPPPPVGPVPEGVLPYFGSMKAFDLQVPDDLAHLTNIGVNTSDLLFLERPSPRTTDKPASLTAQLDEDEMGGEAAKSVSIAVHPSRTNVWEFTHPHSHTPSHPFSTSTSKANLNLSPSRGYLARPLEVDRTLSLTLRAPFITEADVYISRSRRSPPANSITSSYPPLPKRAVLAPSALYPTHVMEAHERSVGMPSKEGIRTVASLSPGVVSSPFSIPPNPFAPLTIPRPYLSDFPNSRNR